MLTSLSRWILAPLACAHLVPAALSQCEAASTHRGFHLQSTGWTLAADGDEAMFGHVSGMSVRSYRHLANDSWEVDGYFTGSGSGASAMGRAVDLRGNLAVVGDPSNWSLPGFWSGSGHGAAVVFERIANVWVRVADLYPPVPVVHGSFGRAVTIATDGARIAVSASNEVHVYVRQGASFALEQTFTGATLSPPTTLGAAAGLVAGHLLLSAGVASGEVRVFARQAGAWVQVDVLAPSQLPPTAYFGGPIAVDGTRVAIGARAQTHAGSTSTGMVFVYDLAVPGWSMQPTTIVPPAGGVTSFGRSLDLHGDRLAAGANQRAFVYRLVAGGNQLLATLHPPTAGFSNQFGQAVALYSSGLLVGDYQYDDFPWQYPNQPGGVHTFDLTDHGQPFVGCARGVDLQWGGPLPLQIDWPQQAGKAYQVFGSISGTGPTMVAGVAIPLTPDAYTTLLFGGALPGLLTGSAGVLSPSGRGSVTFVVPQGLPLALHGLQLHHAVVAFDATAFASSNAVTSTLVRLN